MKAAIIVPLVFTSCSSSMNPKDRFESGMNDYVGREMKFSGGLEKYGIVDVENLPKNGKKYTFVVGKDCKYNLFLDGGEIVTKWSYAGSPQKCWTDGIDWFGPW